MYGEQADAEKIDTAVADCAFQNYSKGAEVFRAAFKGIPTR
jgi:hypothetical protein